MAGEIEHGNAADNAIRVNDAVALETAQLQARTVSKRGARAAYAVWQGTPGGNEAYVEATTDYRNIGLAIGAVVGGIIGVVLGRYAFPKRGR